MAISKADATENIPSEFSWGRGLAAPRPAIGGQGGGGVLNGMESQGLSPYEQLRATRMTDPDNPDADESLVYVKDATVSGENEDGTYKPGNLRPGATPPVREDGVLPSGGQHGIIDPTKYNPGHEPDGFQDGEGQTWRDSVPPNPVL